MSNQKTLVNLILNGQSSSNFFLWRKKYTNINTQSNEVVTLDNFRKLQKESDNAKEECPILKKTLTIFAKNWMILLR